MIRATAAAALLVASTIAAQTYPDMHPKALRVGDVGEFAGSSGPWRFTVKEVVGPDSAVVVLGTFTDAPVLVKGFKTADVADGSTVTLPGKWKVTGTTKRDGRTIFVAERHVAADK
jgi:hypothetical protein